MPLTAQSASLPHSARYLRLYFQDLWSDAAPVVIARSVADVFEAAGRIDSENPAVLIGQYTRMLAKLGKQQAQDVLAKALLALLADNADFMGVVNSGQGHLHAVFFQTEPYVQYKLLHYAAFATESDRPAHPAVVQDIARGLLPPGGDGSALVQAAEAYRQTAA